MRHKHASIHTYIYPDDSPAKHFRFIHTTPCLNADKQIVPTRQLPAVGAASIFDMVEEKDDIEAAKKKDRQQAKPCNPFRKPVVTEASKKHTEVSLMSGIVI